MSTTPSRNIKNKSGIRISKFETNSHYQILHKNCFEHLVFEFRYCFGFRASDLAFAPVVCSDKVRYWPVERSFIFRWEYTSRQLVISAVICDTFAAYSLSRTRFIWTGTYFKIFFYSTIHTPENLLNLFY